jgi:hypothetical protein
MYVGREFSNTTVGKRNSEDGTWSVVVTILEKLTEDGETWQEEHVDAMGVDRTFDAAHRTALQSVLMWMEKEVYAKGFQSLVEAVNANRLAEDATDSNKDTLS